MTLSSEQFHTLYDGAAQPVILVRDGAVAELNCHAQELFLPWERRSAPIYRRTRHCRKCCTHARPCCP